MTAAQTIKPSRKKWGLTGLALVWLGAGAVVKSVSDGSAAGVVVSCLVLVLPGCYALWLALRNRAQFALDATGLTLRSGRRVEWSQVQAVRVARHQSWYGEDHTLVIKLRPDPGAEARRQLVTTNETADDELDLPLDGLSLRWDKTVEAVERYSGLSVGRVRDGAFGSRSDD